MGKIFIIFFCACILLLILFTKNNTQSHGNNNTNKILWSGKCDKKLSLPCTSENNCSVLCGSKFLTEGNCSSLKDSCNGPNCTVECEEPLPVINCGSDYESIWTGKCKEGLATKCSNESCLFTCGKSETPVIDDPRLTNCQAVKTVCDMKRGICSICCKPKIPSSSPKCPDNMQTVWTGSCPFLNFSCTENNCTAVCNGQQVYKGNCTNGVATCQNGECSLCCSNDPNPPKSICNGQEMGRYNCDNISSFCSNGECSIVCDGTKHSVPGCYQGINTICSNNDCLVCC